MKKFNLILLILPLISIAVNAQTDSLVLINGNVIVGEIKNMDRGVVQIETDYSDSDFKLEWSGVKEIYVKSDFLISLSDGRRYNGSFFSQESGQLQIDADGGDTVIIWMDELVYLKSINNQFWSRFDAAIELGISLTKTNNLRQFILNSKLSYLAPKWSMNASYESVNSEQDESDPIRRKDGVVTGRWFLPVDWYVLGSINFLQNTEQQLRLRTNGRVGLGKYVIHTNKSYWGFQGGLSFNNEDFFTNASEAQSFEGYLGTELNLFDVGDIDLLTQINVYPSITNKGRWRSDLKFDTKYDLPRDFYIKIGFTINYDNQPVENASSTDYVFQTTFGWEL